MRIGIDIDGVLTDDDQYILDCGTRFCYENNLPTYQNPNAYETDKWVWTEEVLKQYRQKYYDWYLEYELPRKFAAEVIQKWKQEGNQIYIITSRYQTGINTELGEEKRKKTLSWLQKFQIPYDQVIFCKYQKDEVCQKLGIDLMIEDSPIFIPKLVRIVPVFCFDCRHNQMLQDKNLIRVFSWYDIYQKYLQFKNNV